VSTSAGSTLPPVTLVLGGARSGKSLYAERLVSRFGPGVYLATAEARDEEMAARIRHHRQRRGRYWTTVEEPIDIVPAIKAYSTSGRAVLVDCLTLWLSNLMERDSDVDGDTQKLVAALTDLPGPVVLVSNEVGLGGVPGNALARAFMDAAGRLNQAVALVANRVVFMAAGLPLVLKE
jgi:adenosylcobinamide kinase/adenosylcobinamide-phosphate guanylyltransferase